MEAHLPARLPGVVEPITIVDAISWDDGGSHGVAFRDSRGVTRYACLMDDLEDHHNLVLGSYSPISDEEQLREHPIGGKEERAFRQLLETSVPGRSRRSVVGFGGWNSTQKARSAWLISRCASSGNDVGIDRKGMAVSILRDLRRRHRG